MPGRIEDYALIGDCETAALCKNDGSIDWLCWPRFDSGACFASLLGTPDNGRWKLSPAEGTARTARHYRDRTLILETDFQTHEGAFTLVDFMPLRGKHSHLVRLVQGKQGKVRVKMEMSLRFNYGSTVPLGHAAGTAVGFAPLPGLPWWSFAPRRRSRARDITTVQPAHRQRRRERHDFVMTYGAASQTCIYRALSM